jgi:GTPase
MSYRNKTYVIFDGDKDIGCYRMMKGWRALEHLEFDFHDAHDLNVLTDRAGEESVKRKLRERFQSTKQVIVLVGANTKNLYKFVRWEIGVAISLNLPIIVVNLNHQRSYDQERCPPILRDHYAVHVAYRMKIIQFAMDHFADEYNSLKAGAAVGGRNYPDAVYTSLGL